MGFQMSQENRQLLHEFFQEMLSGANRVERVDGASDRGEKAPKTEQHPKVEKPPGPAPTRRGKGRFSIFRMRPDGIVRIGSVQGIENAKTLLPTLASLDDGHYFLFDMSADKVLTFERERPRT